MHQGNWKCSKCDNVITELPFVPKSENGLTCRSCWSAKNRNVESSPNNYQAKTTFESEEPPYDIPDYAEVASEPMPDDDGLGLGAVPVLSGEKPKFTGEWQCAECGGAITSLPFSPRSTANLKCLDCFKRSR